MSDYAYKVFSAIKIMVKWVKLTVINDNKPNPPLLNDWGWSVLIETDKWTLLYDADTESRVMENNVRALGIDLNRLMPPSLVITMPTTMVGLSTLVRLGGG